MIKQTGVQEFTFGKLPEGNFGQQVIWEDTDRMVEVTRCVTTDKKESLLVELRNYDIVMKLHLDGDSSGPLFGVYNGVKEAMRLNDCLRLEVIMLRELIRNLDEVELHKMLKMINERGSVRGANNVRKAFQEIMRPITS